MTDSGSGLSFYESQENVGDEYFLHISDYEGHGEGTSCYFWFSSPEQLLNSIKSHMDFWDWRDGFEIASEELSRIIDSHPDALLLSSKLISEINDFIISHANIIIWNHGTFKDLCEGEKNGEVRAEFREWQSDYDDDDGESDDDEENEDRPIEPYEVAAFCEFLSQTPS